MKRPLHLAAVLLLASSILDAADAALRQNLAWQIALERVAMSPGLVDGLPGPKTRLATAEFQRVRGLPQTGRLDAATSALLKPEPQHAIATYTVRAADLQQVGTVPRKWVDKSKLSRL
ncbi:peptidoglycan-binding protein, partial [bacterium]|nr:peptidoglycan-binding protein [bacterium]